MSEEKMSGKMSEEKTSEKNISEKSSEKKSPIKKSVKADSRQAMSVPQQAAEAQRDTQTEYTHKHIEQARQARAQENKA